MSKSEFDSIKHFINLNLLIIIACLGIVSIVNTIYAIQFHKIYFRLFWNWFLVYFLIDIMIDVNNEENMYYPKYYLFKKFKIVRLIRYY